jgi:hypothetical protein
MFFSIGALAFLLFVGLSMIHLVDAVCGDSGQAEFNKNGFPQGPDGELYCAVQCILHGDFCGTNQYGADVYPAAARGFDSTNLKAYYGPDISSWCVGLVTDFSFIFQNEVSNV